MGAPESVYRLVEKFERHKPGSETEVRVQFVDELFKALGWDMRDKRQVRHEPRVIIQEAGLERSKRPDYSFHIGNPPDFFVETKMPHVNLERNPIPAFQLRRYGWSGNAPVSVLTDFEEFSVYDCRIQPLRSDPAKKARLRYFQYGEYIEQWDELEQRFSRDAVAGGALREWVEGERIRGFFSVDQAFLREMENWRETLAQEIALHNRGLSQRDLNLLVQRTIDRIVFLRIAEDRDIEAYGRLRSAAADGKQVYEELKIFFNEADDKYNSGLFHFGAEKRASEPDRLSLNIHIPDQPLRRIINSLYFPYSPYEFSVLSADILGQVYEQFLGKVIEISGGVRVEEKPEVRKAGGVYYTPAYIVDYIVENTVGDLLWGKSPKEAEKLRILDPACGSGSFLTGAYQYLLDWHLKFYSGDPARYRNVIREARGRYVLTTVEKRRILQNNIYGVDLDQNAVEVSKLSLLLKMLENEDGSDATGLQTVMFSAGERILPDLSGNIKWGNSLIGSDFYSGEQMTFFDDEELLKVKPFDWDSEDGFGAVMASGGFDAVIGNPPYIRIQTMKETAPETVPYYKQNFVSASKGNYDIYVVFVERGLQLLNKRGLLGFILPHKFFNAKYGEPLRSLIAGGQHLNSIVHFGHQQIFEGATTYTCLLFLNRKPNQRFRYTSVNDVDSWRDQNGTDSGFIDSKKVGAKSWNFIVGNDAIVFEKLGRFQSKLEHVTDRIFQGLKTGSDKFYIVEKLAENDATYTVYSRQDNETHHLEKDLLHVLIKGGDSHKYRIDDTARLILFPYSTDGKLLSDLEIKDQYPLTWEYIAKQEEFLRSRERRKMDIGSGWYAYTRNQALDVISKPKIFTPDIANVPSYSLDKRGDLFFTGGTAGGYGIVPNTEIKSEYLLGLLNSKLLNWYLRHISTSFRGGWYSYEARYIKQLPIRTIDFDDPADVAKHDKMVALVDRMLDWHRQLPGLTGEALRIVNARIERTDREIDELVYALYGLSEDEVRVVEGG